MTMITGSAHIDHFRATCIRQGIEMWVKFGMIPTRGMTITKLMTMATKYTEKRYKRGQAQQCLDDMKAYLIRAKEALADIPMDHEMK